MALGSTALTPTAELGSPYKLDTSQVDYDTISKIANTESRQTLRASSALLKHIKSEAQKKDATTPTKNLLASDKSSTEADPSEIEPIWLIFTTKKFMTDRQRLRPRKVPLQHSLNTNPNASICLVTPDPQRQFKDAIAHPSFPALLSKRIAKVISVKKLEAKFYSFESKRQLRDSYDIFLADDRIITYLVKILGKTFYKSTSKRPIPVSLQVSKPKGQKNAALPSTKPRKVPSDLKSLIAPAMMGKEIERTLNTAQIHFSPSITTAVKVGLASFTPDQVADNIQAVTAALAGKHVAWSNLKAINVKGPNTMALPIWLAEELWTDEQMILEKDEAGEAEAKMAHKGKSSRLILEEQADASVEAPVEGSKRKQINGVDEHGESKGKKSKRLVDEGLSREMKERRERLRQQKKEARERIENTLD